MIDEVKYKLYSRLAYLLAQMTEPWMVNAENSRKNLQLSVLYCSLEQGKKD